MQKNTLLIISLVLSVLGICILFFLKPDISPQVLVINGSIQKINEWDKVSFITFVPDDFLVVSFEKLELTPGKYSLHGRLQQYDGRIEFVVDEIR